MRAFVLVPVFDVSQTEGPPLPEPPPVAPLTGDSHAHLLARPGAAGAREAGYAVERRAEMPGQAEGFVDHRAPAHRALVGARAERSGGRPRPRAGPRPRGAVPGLRTGRRRGRRRDGGLRRAVGGAARHPRAVRSLRLGVGRRGPEGARRLRWTRSIGSPHSWSAASGWSSRVAPVFTHPLWTDQGTSTRPYPRADQPGSSRALTRGPSSRCDVTRALVRGQRGGRSASQYNSWRR